MGTKKVLNFLSMNIMMNHPIKIYGEFTGVSQRYSCYKSRCFLTFSSKCPISKGFAR